jgi:ABC-type uncharacterized transport system involved in gliding motility auxiliary subunit
MKSSRVTLAILLLLVGLVLVNYLASSLPGRLDLTADRIYTLSDGTKSLLGKIEEPITLDFYFTRSANGLPIAAKNYADRVEEILRQYARNARGKIRLNIVDPRPDTPEEERAGLAGISAQALASGDRISLGLVATQAGQQKVIAALSPAREPFLEYDLSQLIYNVQQLDRKKLGVYSSLPIMETQNRALVLQGQGNPGQVVAQEWSNTFELVAIDTNAVTLPKGLDALAIIHPQSISPSLQFEIDQFLLGGKPVFLAVDPSSLAKKRSASQLTAIGSAPPDASSDLPDLLKAYGVAYDPESVIGDQLKATQTRDESGNSIRTPVWLTLDGTNFNKAVQPASQISKAHFLEVGALSPLPGSRTTFTPVVQSSDSAGLLKADLLLLTSGELLTRSLQVTGKKTIAALVTGKFSSAFPNGAPPEPVDPANPTPKPVVPRSSLKESAANSTLFVVADTDWLMDAVAVVKQQFLGQVYIQPRNENLTFATNVLEFLGGSSDLITIRSKGTATRPFDVVEAMEVEADRQYQDKAAGLEKRLGEIQTRLSDLAGKNEDNLKLVASAETTKAIEEARREQATLRSQVREIRRALREGIDALENKLLITNLVIAPVLLCAFGLWFHKRRRSPA